MKRITIALNALIFSALTIMTLTPAIAKVPSTLQIVNLQCQGIVNPLGIDTERPTLSWNLDSLVQDTNQSAYQIIVSNSLSALRLDQGNLWDSGKVSSAETIGVAYDGKRLSSGKSVYWKVRVWDQRGVSSWSQPSEWLMGLLDPPRLARKVDRRARESGDQL